MTLRELAEIVATMRHAQKDYFRTRTQEALNQSKTIERNVDAVLREILDQAGRPLLPPDDE